MKLVNVYVFPILTYGNESWTFYADTKRRIEAFEMWVFRKMGKISWTEKMRNEDVLIKLGVCRKLLVKMKRLKLQYFGHVMRHDTFQKQIVTSKFDGKRARGRPRRTWLDDVKEWTGLGINKYSHIANDRKAWRTLASRPL